MFITIPAIVILLVAAIMLLPSFIVIVKEQTTVLVERLGKYNRTLKAGLNFKIPLIESSAEVVDLRVQQLDVDVETKTKDNVFVRIPVSVQYRVVDPVRSYYMLSNPLEQIRSYIYDRVRASLSKMGLDEAFASKDEIAVEVENTLNTKMADYGYEIVNTLVTDINPDNVVKESMNKINAAQREREAAVQLAEADKVRIVKQAEGEAESKRLQGEGVANQRKAIAEGLASQYTTLSDAGMGREAQEILLMTQYFDTLAEVSRNSRTNTLMVPSSPGGTKQLWDEIRDSIFVGNELSKKSDG